MIADIYSVSKNISKKHTYLMVSAVLFGIGILAAVSSAIVANITL